MNPLDRLIDGIRKETECKHYDYGKSADKALGAYCTEKKKCVEPEDCERCEEGEEEMYQEYICREIKEEMEKRANKRMKKIF
jgi:hypothetical protein